jgi:hypothetical protein
MAACWSFVSNEYAFEVTDAVQPDYIKSVSEHFSDLNPLELGRLVPGEFELNKQTNPPSCEEVVGVTSPAGALIPTRKPTPTTRKADTSGLKILLSAEIICDTSGQIVSPRRAESQRPTRALYT